MLGLSAATAPKARAAFVATIEQVGPDVVVIGGGTIDLTGLSYDTSSNGFDAGLAAGAVAA